MVGFKKALLTFGCVDQGGEAMLHSEDEHRGGISRGSAISKRIAVKLFLGKARFPHLKLGWKSHPQRMLSISVGKRLLSKAAWHRAGLCVVTAEGMKCGHFKLRWAVRVKDTPDSKASVGRKPSVSLIIFEC